MSSRRTATPTPAFAAVAMLRFADHRPVTVLALGVEPGRGRELGVGIAAGSGLVSAVPGWAVAARPLGPVPPVATTWTRCPWGFGLEPEARPVPATNEGQRSPGAGVEPSPSSGSAASRN